MYLYLKVITTQNNKNVLQYQTMHKMYPDPAFTMKIACNSTVITLLEINW